jgi:hypothetical protein
MSPRVLRRLICDADVLTITTDDHGAPLDVGRASRAATAAQRRALRLRDRTCRFPGCHTTRHLHAHHVIEWSDDGPTDLDNLILLCSFHHRFVHDHDWRLEPLPGRPGRYTFHPPDTTAPHPHDLPLPGVSAETPAPPDHHDPHALQPPWWYGDYDLDLAIAVLQEQTRDLAVAA